MRVLAQLGLVAALLCAASCTSSQEPISKYVNRTWSPADLTPSRNQAIASAAQAVSEMQAPDLAFGVPFSVIETVAGTNALKAAGVRALRLQGDQQLLRADMAFAHRFDGPGPLLHSLQPDVQGSLTFYAGITSGTTQGDDTAVLQLTILPTLVGVSIDKVTIGGGKYNVTALGKVLAAAVNDYATKLSEELSRSPLMQISIPTTLPEVQHAIKFPAGIADVTFGSQPIHSPARLFGVAWLITNDSITGIAQTVPVEKSILAAAAPPQAFDALQSRFRESFNRAFNPPPIPARAWVAIRKDLLANVTNSVVQQAAVCIVSNAELPQQTLQQEIGFPPPDPLICESANKTKKALCQAGQKVLQHLAETVKFANIEAGIRAKTENLRVCLQQLQLSPQFDKVEMTLHATGGAAADVDLKFIPLGIAGKLACQTQWTESQTFHATLREENLSFTPTFSLLTNAAAPRVTIKLPAGDVPLHLEPGPTAFLQSSPNLTVACEGLNLLKPLLVAATPHIPQLRGDIDYRYPEREITVDLPLPRQRIGDLEVSGRLDQSGEAFFLIGDVVNH